MSDIPEELIDHIQADRDKARDVVSILTAMVDSLQQTVARHEAERDRLREALQRCREEFEQWHDAKHVVAIIDAALAKEAGK